MLLGRLPFVLTAGAALVIFGQARAANACSLPACVAPVRIPNEGYLPGNLVYFEVTADAPGAITLRTEAGEPIPASIRTIGNDRVFAPDAPIAPETYVILEYDYACHAGNQAPPERGTFEFWTVEFNSIALQPARLFVREYGVADPGVDNNEAGFVRLGMDSPDANYSATHLMTHTATIDGLPVSDWAIPGVFDQLGIQSRCRPESAEVQYDSCGGIWSVPVGRHTVSVQTRVLGYDGVIAPVTLDIETTCPGGDRPVASDNPVADTVRPDPAPMHEPPPAPPPADIDTATGEAAASGNASSDIPDESCALGRGHASPTASAGLALVALGMLARRRRRSH
jgi:MYXO-CTERM domain-containing protein